MPLPPYLKTQDDVMLLHVKADEVAAQLRKAGAEK